MKFAKFIVYAQSGTYFDENSRVSITTEMKEKNSQNTQNPSLCANFIAIAQSGTYFKEKHNENS